MGFLICGITFAEDIGVSPPPETTEDPDPEFQDFAPEPTFELNEDLDEDLSIDDELIYEQSFADDIGVSPPPETTEDPDPEFEDDIPEPTFEANEDLQDDLSIEDEPEYEPSFNISDFTPNENGHYLIDGDMYLTEAQLRMHLGKISLFVKIVIGFKMHTV